MYAHNESEAEQLLDLIEEQVKFEICRTLNPACNVVAAETVVGQSNERMDRETDRRSVKQQRHFHPSGLRTLTSSSFVFRRRVAYVTKYLGT